MKKSLFFGMMLILAVSGCERDEICIEEISPKLIIRFYDQDDPDQLKQVLNLKVNVEGIEEDYVNETITALTDSIAIPILVTEDLTRYHLTLQGNEIQGTEDNTDIFEIRYSREDVFVSRPCGYKTQYLEASVIYEADEDPWILSMETANTPQDITNENSAHVKIYH